MVSLLLSQREGKGVQKGGHCNGENRNLAKKNRPKINLHEMKKNGAGDRARSACQENTKKRRGKGRPEKERAILTGEKREVAETTKALRMRLRKGYGHHAGVGGDRSPGTYKRGIAR